MTRENLIKLCQQAPKIGSVGHEEFVDYIVVLDKVCRVNGKWEKTEAAYMSVDGKVAMANEDHRRQEKKLHFEDPVVLVNNQQSLTLLVALNSEIYGRRHGIATSRKLGGSPYEATHPWEIAETSAVGRALSAMGYGVLPGSGMASAEDIKHARQAEMTNLQKPAPRQSPGEYRQAVRTSSKNQNGRPTKPITGFQQQKIQQYFAELYPDHDTEIGVEQLFLQEVGRSLNHATYNDARHVMGYLLRQKRNKVMPLAEAAA